MPTATEPVTEKQESKQGTEKLIEELVKQRNQRQSTNGKAPEQDGPNIKNRTDLWQKLRKEPFYIVEISIKVGPASVRIDGSDLGLKPEVLDELADIASSGYKAKFKALEAAANKLKKFVERVYQYSIVVEPLRLVHQKHLPATIRAIEELKSEAQTLRKGLLDTYDRDYTTYLESIHKFLFKAALSEEQIKAAMQRYADAYPTPDTFEAESLQVVIKRLEKIPSILEQIQKDTQLAQAQVEQEQTEAELQKIRLLQIGQESLENDLLSIFSHAQTRSRDEALGQFAELIDRMGGTAPEQITAKSRSAWNAIFDRLEILACHDEQVGALLEVAKKLRALYQVPDTSVELLQKQLDVFRSLLKKSVKQDCGEGASRLSRVLNLEASYKYLCSELETLESNPDALRLHDLEAQINSLENVFQFRHLDLKRRKAKVKKALAKSLGVHFSELDYIPVAAPDISRTEVADDPQPVMANQASQPYDPEAGF